MEPPAARRERIDQVRVHDRAGRVADEVEPLGAPLTPRAPCTWMARSMTLQATRGAITLMAAISVFADLAPPLSIIDAAGWPIWFIIVTSIAALAIIIERFWSLRTPLVAPRDLLARLRKYRGRLPAGFKFDRLGANERG